MKTEKTIGVLANLAIYLIAFALAFVPYYYALEGGLHFTIAMLIYTLTATFVVYIFCLFLRNTSIYDPYWSVAPFVMLIIHMVTFKYFNVNAIIFAILVFLYSFRLTRNWFLTYSGLNPKYEDWRYQKYRNSLPTWQFQFVNFFGLIFFPTLVVYICLVPGLYFVSLPEFNPLAIIGFVFMFTGPLLELIADYQVHKFIRESNDHSKVCNYGLWNYSRHPNYLGELMFWFGIMLTFMVIMYEKWYLGLGFIVMLFLFTCISIPMMEKHNNEKRPAYKEYKKHTSMLLILPRRK